ncbi:hypothetical protein L9F63_016497 [Diploptera punctata]|uniref:CHK kinase-like domain-containing protein n=1 Tax=Diploptera punctata TaxID=6984 RepID=A0AAD8A157_DIPPU|nr:hypothetical protein L9F63_016497 [Diploptera punctata]
MYTETIPAFLEFIRNRCELSYNEYDLFPKCYFAKWENKKGAVVLQDMRSVGFRVCEQRVILDYDHCVVLLKALGRFHAISYGMKKINSSLFHQLAKKFKETMMSEESFFKITLGRVVEYLERTKDIDEDTFQRSLVESLADILGCAVTGVERKYTLEMIRNEFRDYAFFGFMIDDFFLPEMVAGPVEQINYDEMAHKTWKDLAEAYAKIGGDSATALVADMVKDMAEMGVF